MSGKYYKAGSIIPRHLAKADVPRLQYLLKFGTDVIVSGQHIQAVKPGSIFSFGDYRVQGGRLKSGARWRRRWRGVTIPHSVRFSGMGCGTTVIEVTFIPNNAVSRAVVTSPLHETDTYVKIHKSHTG